MENYLTNMPTELLSEYGLAKTLFTRRETIYIKHIMKNIFEYGNEDDLNEKLKTLHFKSVFSYMQYLTSRIRGLYKIPREINVDNINAIVKCDRGSICPILDLYKPLKPVIILDFDRTLTKQQFHQFYNYIIDAFKVIINSANPNKEQIEQYFDRHRLKKTHAIYANKGKQKKIIKLKWIAVHNTKKPLFYIDDEIEYLNYGVMLGMYTYHYRKNNKLYTHTFFKK